MASNPITLLCPTKELNITWVQISPSHAGGATEGSLGTRLGKAEKKYSPESEETLRQWFSNFSGHENLLGNMFRIRFLGPSLHLTDQNVLEHLYFDKIQTADLGPPESLERLGNPPRAYQLFQNKSHPSQN